MGETPEPAHWAVKFLSTGMMGSSWGEHVALEMALGEGLVLSAFYALVDTIEDPEIHRILETATTEEERHVEFGETETRAWLQAHPESRGELLAQAIVQVWVLKKLKGFITKKLLQGELAQHPVLIQFDSFFEKVIAAFELRIERLGLSWSPIESLGHWERVFLVVSLPFKKFLGKFRFKAPLLTSTYLSDPSLLAQQERFRASHSEAHSVPRVKESPAPSLSRSQPE
jgi:hypothetical protein